MPKFYFTYGTGGQPFVGGWTEVEALDMPTACAVFRAYHPDKTEGLLNCSGIYRSSSSIPACMQKETLVPTATKPSSCGVKSPKTERSNHYDQKPQ